MLLNLTNLREVHPLLSEPQAEEFNRHGALGLERAGHASGVAIGLTVEEVESEGWVAWSSVPGEDLARYDRARVTEITAEGVALVLAHQAQGWRVWMRGQRGQFCDWIMTRDDAQGMQELGLEAAGLAEGSISTLLRAKLKQVALSAIGDRRCAVVVGLAAPEARMCSQVEDAP